MVFFVRFPQIRWLHLLGITGALVVAKFSFLFFGMNAGMPPGLTSLVLQTQAFFTVILAALILREYPRPLQIAGIGVAFVGIALIYNLADASVTSLSIGLVLLAAVAWAVSNLFMRVSKAPNMLAVMVWASLIGSPVLFGLSLLVEGPRAIVASLQAIDFKSAFVVVYSAFGSTILGYVAWGMLIRTYGAGQVAVFSLLVPIFGMSSAWLIYGEPLGGARLAAAALVIVGLGMVAWRRRRVQLPA
jgi:O-acetylserine/cysteine efflux transporter